MIVLTLLAWAMMPTLSLAQSGEWALATCQADEQCRARFFLEVSASEYTSVTFAHLYAQYANASALPSSFNTSDTTNVQLWLALMRKATFCDANQSWVLGRGCTCASGKHCGTRTDANFVHDLSSFEVAVAVVGVVGAVAWHFHRKQLERVSAVSDALLEEVRAPRSRQYVAAHY